MLPGDFQPDIMNIFGHFENMLVYAAVKWPHHSPEMKEKTSS